MLGRRDVAFFAFLTSASPPHGQAALVAAGLPGMLTLVETPDAGSGVDNDERRGCTSQTFAEDAPLHEDVLHSAVILERASTTSERLSIVTGKALRSRMCWSSVPHTIPSWKSKTSHFMAPTLYQSPRTLWYMVN